MTQPILLRCEDQGEPVGTDILELFRKIRAAFQHEFITKDGRVSGETQTAYLLALGFNLVPEGLISAAVEHLVHDSEASAFVRRY